MSPDIITTRENKSFPPKLFFIPRPFEMPERPELSVFPQNILIAGFKENIEDVMIAGYIPDLETYILNEYVRSLKYLNNLDSNHWLEISYDEDKSAWSIEKYYQDKLLGNVYGIEWQGFFYQLGLLGLGEEEIGIKLEDL